MRARGNTTSTMTTSRRKALQVFPLQVAIVDDGLPCYASHEVAVSGPLDVAVPEGGLAVAAEGDTVGNEVAIDGSKGRLDIHDCNLRGKA
jgi:hypothetical protein